MKWSHLLVVGLLLLLLGAYLDSMRGPLLPLITADLNISYGLSSAFLAVGNLAGIVATLSMLPILNRFSEVRITQLISVFSIGLVIYSFFVHAYDPLLVLAAGIGIAVALLGAMANVLTVRGSQGRTPYQQFCGLHAMFGLGSFLAAMVTSLVVAESKPWPWALVLVAPVSLLCYFLVSTKNQSSESAPAASVQIQSSRLSQTQVFMVGLFGIYAAGEVMTSMWMPSYLVVVHHWQPAVASRAAGGFFFLIFFTRVLSMIFWRPRFTIPLIWASLLIPAAVLLIGLLGRPEILPLAGCIGPFFPLYLGRLTVSFPSQWRAITIWVIVALQVTLGSLHLTIGAVTTYVDMQTAYWIPLGLVLLTASLFWFYRRLENQLFSQRAMESG